MIQWLGGFPSHEKCPSSRLPEFALAGRSNVGKSSLINALLGRKELAYTSSRPGKTQAIHLYEVGRCWLLCDLPGYGYAKISRTQREAWLHTMRNYFLHRPNLFVVFQLIDISIEPKPIDLDFGIWLGERQIPMAVVLTKIDKQKPGVISKNREALQASMLQTWEILPPFFETSSSRRLGVDALSDYIRALATEKT